MFIPSAFEERLHDSFFCVCVCACRASTFTHTPPGGRLVSDERLRLSDGHPDSGCPIGKGGGVKMLKYLVWLQVAAKSECAHVSCRNTRSRTGLVPSGGAGGAGLFSWPVENACAFKCILYRRCEDRPAMLIRLLGKRVSPDFRNTTKWAVFANVWTTGTKRCTPWAHQFISIDQWVACSFTIDVCDGHSLL